jgi:hypothetical protein
MATEDTTETTLPPTTTTSTSTTTGTTTVPPTTAPPTPGSTTCYPCLSCPDLIIESPPLPIELTTKKPTPLNDLAKIKVPPSFPLSNPSNIVETTVTTIIPIPTSTSTSTPQITTVAICNIACNRLGY